MHADIIGKPEQNHIHSFIHTRLKYQVQVVQDLILESEFRFSRVTRVRIPRLPFAAWRSSNNGVRTFLAVPLNNICSDPFPILDPKKCWGVLDHRKFGAKIHANIFLVLEGTANSSCEIMLNVDQRRMSVCVLSNRATSCIAHNKTQSRYSPQTHLFAYSNVALDPYSFHPMQDDSS